MEELIGSIVAGRYQIEKKIGKGSFGEIFQAVNLVNKEKVGIKVEFASHEYPQLVYESRIYDALRGGPGIPYLYWFGTESSYNFLVMDLLGASFEALLDRCNRSFSLKTVLLIADQMVSRIEYMHSQNYIHRDIKPENFVIGTEARSKFIYIIDYGLCKKYANWRTGEHIPYIEGKSLTGTARYASINTHIGIEQSRRDDLECLGYVFVYFFKGKLPWQDINLPDKADRYEAIKEIKMQTAVYELCEGMPAEFVEFMNYSRSLRFDETPSYTYLKNLFENLRFKMKFENDFLYDWDVLNSSNEERTGNNAAKKRNSNNNNN
jgi:serine/threonine protein kinase